MTARETEQGIPTQEPLDSHIIDALEDAAIDPTGAYLEESSLRPTHSDIPSIFIVHTGACTAFIWDYGNNGELSVYSKQPHKGD